MRALVKKSEIAGKVVAPASKSYTIRGLMCAALARGQSEIVYPLGSDDTGAAINVLRQIGINVQQKEDLWWVSGGDFCEPDADLFCGESAATWRFMIAISSLVSGKCHLVPAPPLARRPIRPLLQALQQLGVNSVCQKGDSSVVIKGDRIKGGTTELPGDISSQFISALLFIAPFTERGVVIRLTTPLESKPYVMMTMECLREFGIEVKVSTDFRGFAILRQTYRPIRYQVEGDWSSVSYFLALGAVCGEVELVNLNPNSRQGDKILVDFLKDMGVMVEVGESSVKVGKSRLRALRTDLSDCIDLLPTMAALAAVADGESEFTGIARARLKESDRVAAVKEGLGRMGIIVREEKDKLAITGGSLRGAVIDTKGDHRIAMAFSILGSVAGETVLDGAECVSKTFPQYWEVLRSIGGKVEINE